MLSDDFKDREMTMGKVEKIRVATYDGPGAEPVIREVP